MNDDGRIAGRLQFLSLLWFVVIPWVCVGIAFAHLVGWMP